MKCPGCQIENPGTGRYCPECGARLLSVCSQCGSEILPNDKFCCRCGLNLELEKRGMKDIEGERKHVTVLFSDLSGFTSMSEKLDPEEIKEIVGRINKAIIKVVARYEGSIERYIGDQVMVLFGAPKAHEDDSLRAVRAAREIHDLVEAMGSEFKGKIRQRLTMHTGIDTGLVVIGGVDFVTEKDIKTGDAINLASRLCSLAKAGEILVGHTTYCQVEGHFTFESLAPTRVKGKSEPVKVYKFLAAKEEPTTMHRLSGFRADLIGRKVEMAQLEDSYQQLREGKGAICVVCGDAGTGKSRLVREFKAALNVKEIQWLEGHAYDYSQNVSYFPLIDLLNRSWRIEEGYQPERIGEQVESSIKGLLGEDRDVTPFIGRLYSLDYPEIEDVSPDFWRVHLFEAVLRVLEATIRKAPTVIFLEDMHWADPSSLDLFRFVMAKLRYPVLFLCAIRPEFTLFTQQQLKDIGKSYQNISLKDLSSSETYQMIESLLKTTAVPVELGKFFRERVEGNPFYVEEVINSLVESGTVVRSSNGEWGLTRPISESDIPSTIQGVISARLDRLESEMKRLLQEASVIGRAFLYDVLRKITRLQEQIDNRLSRLEQIDLIRTRTVQPDLEYIFKHALTQEVAYSSLLKKERQEIHERIALVVEQLFHDRLPDFYETLAFHFMQGLSLRKAIEYLMKSGEKSLGRYSLDEAHRYYKEALDLLKINSNRSKEDNVLLIDLLSEWAFVFYFRGDWKGLEELFSEHENLAMALEDKAKLGMYLTWLGAALLFRGKPKKSYQYLTKGLKLAEDAGDERVIGHACLWHTFTSAELGKLDEAVYIGKRAVNISKIVRQDQHLFYWPLITLGMAYWFRGESTKNIETGKILLELGERHSSIRSLVTGHWFTGCGYLTAGDYASAIESYKKGVQVSADPFYSFASKAYLGLAYALNSQFQEAEGLIEEILVFFKNFGDEYIGTPAYGILGVVEIDKGNMSRGMRIIEEAYGALLENERRWWYCQFDLILGQVYLQIAHGTGPKKLSILFRNIGFLLKNVPFARKKAEAHLNKAIEVAREIGAKSILGQASLSLGTLLKERGRRDKAMRCIEEAVQSFEQCEADVFLKKAREVLETLG